MDKCSSPMEAESKINMANLRAFGNRVLVTEAKEERSAIIIPDGVHTEWLRGIIIEANDAMQSFNENWRPPCVGDVIYFTRCFKIRNLMVVELDDIIAVETND